MKQSGRMVMETSVFNVRFLVGYNVKLEAVTYSSFPPISSTDSCNYNASFLKNLLCCFSKID